MEFPFSPVNLFRDFKKPKSLEINDVTHLHNTWCGVTVKQDGVLVALYYSGCNLVNVYQMNGTYVTSIPCYTPFEGVVFAEHVDNGMFVLFECNLKTNLRKREKFLNSLVFKENTVTVNKYIFTKTPFHVKWNEEDEGVIITSVYNHKLPVCKFKKINTVDFYIKNNQCYCMISKDQYFKLNESLKDASDAVDGAYFPFLFKLNPTFSQDDDGTLDDCVAECYLDTNTNTWKLFRVRQDKTDEFKKMKTGPNNWSTCLVHYHLFHAPLTLEFIQKFIENNM